MKNKASFSPRSIQQAVVDHLEKVVFGALVLVFLWIAYRAWGREQLGWGPSDLSTAVSQAQDTVSRAHEILPKEKMPQVRPYGPIAQGIRTPIVWKTYQSGGSSIQPGPPMFVSLPNPFQATMSLRSNPELFPLRDLRVAAGSGAFAMGELGEEGPATTVGSTAMAGTGFGAEFRGQRWVVVTGLIDFEKQREAYDTAFHEASFHSPMDFPIYSYYYVERAEIDPQNPVDPQDPAAQLTWVPLKTRDAFKPVLLSWRGTSPEVVDLQFIPWEDEGGVPLVFPLGPLYNRTWGAEVAHPPEIRIFELSAEGFGTPYGPMGGTLYGMPPKRSTAKAAEEAKDASDQPASKADEEAQKKADAERRKKARERLQPNLPDAPVAGGGPPGGVMPGAGAGPSPMTGMSPYGGNPYGAGSYGMRSGVGSSPYSGDVGRRFMGSPMGSYGPGMSVEGEAVELPKVLLFRFFDFAVEPGKHYSYRVKLLLRNPNATVNPQYLASDDLGRRPHLETPVSEPSPVVAVPRDSQALLVAAQPSGADPKATLMLVHFNYDDGALASEKFQAIVRGQLLDFRGRTVKASQAGLPGPYGAGLPDPQAGSKKVDYLTEVVVLDVAGGGRLPQQKGDLTECASVLLLDPDGKLVVREEIDDLADVRQQEAPERPGRPGVVGPEGPTTFPRGTSIYNPYETKAKKPKKGAKGQPGYPGGGGAAGYSGGGPGGYSGGGPPPGYPSGGAAGYSGGGPAGYSGGGPPPGYPTPGGMPKAKGGRPGSPTAPY
jgi:hypothetical protein